MKGFIRVCWKLETICDRINLLCQQYTVSLYKRSYSTCTVMPWRSRPRLVLMNSSVLTRIIQISNSTRCLLYAHRSSGMCRTDARTSCLNHFPSIKYIHASSTGEFSCSLVYRLHNTYAPHKHHCGKSSIKPFMSSVSLFW